MSTAKCIWLVGTKYKTGTVTDRWLAIAGVAAVVAIGPQGERVWPISVVKSTRRREDKNYRLSHRDVSGGLADTIALNQHIRRQQ